MARKRQSERAERASESGKHCAFYLMSATTVATHQEELAKYDTSKGTIRFMPDNPLPAALVRKLVKARIAENRDELPTGKSGRNCIQTILSG